MKIQDITRYLESVAPLSYQESYDNAGLIVGDAQAEVTGVLLCLDSVEAVIDEALAKGCNLVIAHHPIVFGGLKKFNGRNYVERTVMKAIKNDVAIYAIHTNLDNVARNGVNAKISERLGLLNTRILAPKKDLMRKLVVFCPTDHAEAVRNAMFGAGAGAIGDYDQCSFNLDGTGTFRASDDADPFVGKKGERHHEAEVRIEVVYNKDRERAVISAMSQAHPYEEVAHDIYALQNASPQIGSGMIGELKEPLSEEAFLTMLKKQLNTACVRHTATLGKPVKTVAVCGGAGSFLLGAAKGQRADVFVTADYKYHQFFDADGQIMIADVGHYESEQYTIELLAGILKEKFANFALHLTDINTNPINYC